MNILFFITGLGLGGAETITVNIAENFAKNGHRVSIVYLTGRNEYFKNQLSSIDFFSLSMTKNPFSFIKSLLKARKILKKTSPDVIHSQMFHSNIFVRLLRFFSRMPLLVCSEHSVNIEGRWRMLAYRFTDFLSDMNTNVSKESVAYFVKVKAFSSLKSFPMYNGIDLSKCVINEHQLVRREFGCFDSDFLLLNAGRLTYAKNQKLLIEAMALVDNCKLIICGQGECEDDLRETIDKLKLQNRVFLAGARSNMTDFYSAADCFVLSSLWEGLPMVILEAMGFKLPIISTNVGGAFETINDSNWIIPVNDKSSLVNGISKMKDLPLLKRNEIGNDNLKKVQMFDLNAVCDEWINHYIGKV